jgi:hypothetical protein
MWLPRQKPRHQSVDPVAWLIGAIRKPLEKFIQSGVVYRFAGGVRLQVTLSYVGHVIGIINHNLVPGFVLGGTAVRDLLVPLLATVKFRIDINDDTAIVKFDVVYYLSNREMGFG